MVWFRSLQIQNRRHKLRKDRSYSPSELLALEKVELVTPVSPVVRSGSVPFSFTQDRFRQPQPVQAILGSFEYPGEVVLAPNWQSEFGVPLSGISGVFGVAPDKRGTIRQGDCRQAEMREGYFATNDLGLSRLLSSLADHESKINETLVRASHESWKSGKLITSDRQRDVEIN